MPVTKYNQILLKITSEIITENIKMFRKKLGWSRNELAKQAGIGSTTVSFIERGLRVPNLVTACGITEALGITIEELTGYALLSLDEVDELAQEFYLKFRVINNLNKKQQNLMLSIAKELYAKNND